MCEYSSPVLVPAPAPPTAVISSPQDGAQFPERQLITFDGTASSDPVDPVLAFEWSSNLDESIGTSSTFTRDDLSPGTHTITLSVNNTANSFDFAEVAIEVLPVYPVVEITSPQEGDVFGSFSPIVFTGSATDASGAVLSGASLVWTSSLDSHLGTGESFQLITLAIGTHTIELTATDANGIASSSTLQLTVQLGLPTVTITAPVDQSVPEQGDAITFSGSATDVDGAPITGGGLIWTSSFQDFLGTGETFTRNDLLPGLHVVRLSATDDVGRIGHATITITVVQADAVGRIVFTSDRDGDDEIFVMDADGTEVTPLTNDNARDKDPVWSPDGLHVYFATDRDTGAQGFDEEVYRMFSDGTSPQNLTQTPGEDDAPAVSVGDRIAFRSQRDGNPEIYVMESDGTLQTNLTNHAAQDAGPAWSPDGSRIAFYSDRDGDEEIYVMDADGSSLVQLTDNFNRDEDPAWSPDGNWIAFSRDGNIWVMRADGSQPRHVVDLLGGESDPAWSPDGALIAFTSTFGGNDEIWVARVDGGGTPINLTTSFGDDGDPDWR